MTGTGAASTDAASLLAAMDAWLLPMAAWDRVCALLDDSRAARATGDPARAADALRLLAALGLAEARSLEDLPEPDVEPIPRRARRRKNVLVRDLDLGRGHDVDRGRSEPAAQESGSSWLGRRFVQLPAFDLERISFASDGRHRVDAFQDHQPVPGMLATARSLDRRTVELIVELDEFGVIGDVVEVRVDTAGRSARYHLAFAADVDGSLVGLVEFRTPGDVVGISVTLPFPVGALGSADLAAVLGSIEGSSSFNQSAWRATVAGRPTGDPLRQAVEATLP